MISEASRAYFAINKMLSKNTKEKVYTCYPLLVAINACKTWSTMQGDEEKLIILERKFLRKINAPGVGWPCVSS